MPLREAEESASYDVAVIGGGLAGMAASVALGEQGLRVVLLEARNELGGRASSFQDAKTGESFDFCQHVSMRCCVNLADLCQRLGIGRQFTCLDRLNFADARGRKSTVGASRWLPAPLHLGPSLFGLRHLKLRDRLAIAWGMWRLMRLRAADLSADRSFAAWLQANGQSPEAIKGFWHVVLVSALAETLDRVSVAAARKVFVDGFLSDRHGYEVLVPDLPLSKLFGTSTQIALAKHGTEIRLGAAVRQVSATGAVSLDTGESLHAKRVVLAVPWRRAARLLADETVEQVPQLLAVTQLEASPITGVHLWFDVPITDASHWVLVGCRSHWLFSRGESVPPSKEASTGHYYQVVISASRELIGADRPALVESVLDDLSGICPAVRSANLLDSRVVTHREAVFSPLPGVDAIRPPQHTAVPWLFLAGDWTQTDWPATMEGAVRSGYLAAEALLESLDRKQECLVAASPRAKLARWLIR